MATAAINTNIIVVFLGPLSYKHKVFDEAIPLPKLGKVRCRISKRVCGCILSATVSRSRSGKYFVSLCCTDVEIKCLPPAVAIVGVDMGLVRSCDIICIEDLAPGNMVKNHKLAQSVSGASWGKFRRKSEYKANWHGKTIVGIDRFFPSSQLCSHCGFQWSSTKDLSVRKWICPQCGTFHDRDINTSINLLNEGLRLLA